MTDKAFWKRMEIDVLPHVKKHHKKHIRYFCDKLARVKKLKRKDKIMFHHEWLSVSQNLSNFYLYEGKAEFKALIKHCVDKVGGTLPKHLL